MQKDVIEAHRRARRGKVIKAIANNPSITQQQLLRLLPKYGVKISLKTLSEEINLLKMEYGLLSPEPRLNSYVLQGMQTIGTTELPTVIDALWAFGYNLHDSAALSISRRLGSTSRTIVLRQKNIYRKAESPEDIEDKVALAIREHLGVRLVLESPRLSSPKTVEGFALSKFFYERGWYLVTRETYRKAYYACRVDRIRSIEIMKNHPANEEHDQDIRDSQTLINSGWGMDFPHTFEEYNLIKEQPEVVVRFDASAAPFIKEGGSERHPKAKLNYAPDGSGHLDFRIRLRYYNEFRNWVRSWGSKAWFLEPQSFVDEERSDLLRQAWNYGMKASIQTAE